jgi:hypothetical protein
VFILGARLAGEIGADTATSFAIKAGLFILCSAVAVYRFGLLRSGAGKDAAPPAQAAEAIGLAGPELNTTALR